MVVECGGRKDAETCIDVILHLASRVMHVYMFGLTFDVGDLHEAITC